MLNGCAAKSQQPTTAKTNRNFNRTVTVELAGKAFTAQLSSDPSGCVAVFSAPAEVSGLKVEWRGGTLSYSLGELKLVDPPMARQTNFLPLLCQAMSDVAAVQKKAEGVISLEGETEKGHYVLNINEKDLTPEFFEIESADLTVKFG